MYVHKDYQRKNIAKNICDKLENKFVVPKIITHASITAKIFFEKRNYEIIQKKKVLKQEIELKNYIMEKVIKKAYEF